MFNRVGKVNSALHMMPQVYSDALVLAVITYFGCKFVLFTLKVWREFRDEQRLKEYK